MPNRLRTFSLSALLALCLALPAWAADPSATLLDLHQQRLATQRSLAAFFMFNGMEGDQRYARMIDESLQLARSRLDKLGELPGESSKALATRLAQEWQGYENDLKTLVSTLKTQGFTDLQPVADLAERNRQLMELSGELYARIQRESAFSVPPLTQQSREQSLLMQDIALDYASRSASVGATFFGGNEGKAIDELAEQFSAGLARLEEAPANTAETRQGLQVVGTKWRYIEKSLKNYNENSVPFVISKYSDRIIEALEVLSAQYAAQSL
ncbi:hypothetical protein [Pseudomonas indica]|uniref:hypothetical protein n=1 Tax=Pseudomonas indica TaxID=137658 RepID=UPI000BABD026|nr:hypothetical protein [Pseudomonas indica]PAU62535.1 hypothetical protein BZL42_05715 [Pseudomonas indica]